MKKLSTLKRFLCAGLALTMLAGVVAGCGGDKKKEEAKPAANQVTKINFPTAGASGALYAVGAAITNNWSKNVPGVQAASQASAGGIANLNMVADNEAQVSIAISSNALQAMKGTDSFKDHGYKDLKVIAGLYMNPNQIVVSKKSGINSLAEVKGKHFAVAAAGSSVYNEAKAHFTAAGLNFPDDFKAELIAFGPAADMLQNGTLDGAWIMSGAPAAAVSQALTADCKLLPVDDATMAKLQAQYPWYAKYTIPAKTYPNQDQDIQTSAIKMVMFCRHDLSEDLVYKLTKSFWEHIDELGAAQKNLKGLKPADAVKDIAGLPLHPGAEKYYKEIGVLK